MSYHTNALVYLRYSAPLYSITLTHHHQISKVQIYKNHIDYIKLPQYTATHTYSQNIVWSKRWWYNKCVLYITCQKYSVTVIFYYIFHIKPQFLKILFQSQFLFDFDEIFTNRSENVRSFL